MAHDFFATNSEHERATVVPVSAAPLTLVAWVRATPTGGAQIPLAILDRSGAGGVWNGFYLSLADAAPFTVSATAVVSNAFQHATSVSLWRPGRWFFAAGVFASTTSRTATVNGLGAGTNTVSSVPAGMTTTLIGTGGDNGSSGSAGLVAFMNGQVAYPSVWNIALSDNDLVALAQGHDPLRIRRANLVSSWDDFCRDRVGTNHMTTVQGRVFPIPRRLRPPSYLGGSVGGALRGSRVMRYE